MPLTVEQVKSCVDLFFHDVAERDAAFGVPAFQDELGRALSYIEGGGLIDFEYFNRVLIASNLGPVDRTLFEHYFPRGINSEDKLSDGVREFARDALLHFGSFHQAFFRMKADPRLLRTVEQRFGGESRAPFALSNPLKVEELAYLGYVSGELPARMTEAHKAILRATEALGSREPPQKTSRRRLGSLESTSTSSSPP